ncbi:microtubule-associated protein futsch [Caerostris extrusa]|uniref:Microtubule-associated protein futsch n=1 Tax=Caerostris extrusa TaxID=172846 RepID=A0AAV4XIJ0_CAEEX|nr:microtubule-associated protein futsch [Caerostris extrusa]
MPSPVEGDEVKKTISLSEDEEEILPVEEKPKSSLKEIRTVKDEKKSPTEMDEMKKITSLSVEILEKVEQKAEEVVTSKEEPKTPSPVEEDELKKITPSSKRVQEVEIESEPGKEKYESFFPVEKETAPATLESDSTLKVIENDFLFKASKQIQDYDLMLRELETECVFPSGNAAQVLFETVCCELRLKRISITIETVIKNTLLNEQSFSRTSGFVTEHVFEHIYDEDIISPVAESVMGEEMEIREEDLDEISPSGIIKFESAKERHADSKPIYKTVYEKPEAEQVFRHIFAETIVDDEIEVLPDKASSEIVSVQTSVATEEEEKK